MTNHIYTPSSEELESRIGRFEDLQEMSTAKEYEWCGQEALDVIFARKLMPVILDDTKNPFGNIAPIIGAAGTTMFISIMPPGQGPCLHSHNSTYETFIVLEGSLITLPDLTGYDLRRSIQLYCIVSLLVVILFGNQLDSSLK